MAGDTGKTPRLCAVDHCQESRNYFNQGKCCMSNFSISPVWKVDFRTYDLSPEVRNEASGSLVLVTKYWTASVTAFFVPERLFMSKRLMNPLGFTVTRYSQTEVEIL